MVAFIVLTVIVYGLIGWFLFSRLAPVKDMKSLGADEFRERLENSKNKILIDVREPHELQGGSLPGAIHIPLSQLKKRMGEIPAKKEIFLYCRNGMRSRQAARILRKQGFTSLTHLHGGILSWNGRLVK